MQDTKNEKKGWVPVHPEYGPDWSAFVWDEDEANYALVTGYEWKRCTVRVINPSANTDRE